MSSKKIKARLLTAYVWDCDECGAENFLRPMTAEVVEDDREKLFRRFHDLDEWSPLPDGWQDFQLVTRPNSVECRECSSVFEAEDDGCEL